MTAPALAWVQGGFYLTTGIWPLLSMRTFEAVTGRKNDHWLVNTVGLLLGVMGATLMASAARGGPSRDLRTAAAGTALALASIDTFYASRGRISKIYLVDALAEVTLAAAWLQAPDAPDAPDVTDAPDAPDAPDANFEL